MFNQMYGVKQQATSLDIYIYDEVKRDSYDWWTGEKIESNTSAEYIRNLLEKNQDVSQINVYINSFGGEVKEGLGIYNQLKRHKAYKTAYIDGYACSIASVIPMACNNVIMGANTLMMIHNASACVCGNSKELRKHADDLDVINQASVSSYIEKAGEKLSQEKLTELLDGETWLNAQQCIEYGLADEIFTPKTTENPVIQEYQMMKSKEFEKFKETKVQQNIKQEAHEGNPFSAFFNLKK